MSANATATARLAPTASVAVPDAERSHRVRLYALYAVAIAINLAIFIYGFDYYKLSAIERPFSPKHHLLRPSGPVGLYLGFFGVALFLGIFLYPIRKHWAWLAAKGSTRHWLDIHILMGLTAPAIVAFHSTLKFKGLAGMAFWIMFAVSASGVVGRYLYGQIPRKVTTAELSMRELQDLQAHLAQQLAAQNLLPKADLQALLRLPDPNRVARLPVAMAIIYMILLDVARKFRVARLRRHALKGNPSLTTLFGFLPTRHREVERAIRAAAEEARLSKKVLFLSRSQKVFHLWHIVHKPFSYAFAVLAMIHIGLQFVLGYF
ncbi:MAG TPA: hypothetical protein VN310_03645 [Candidatus Dormibacteraeota bacterium]|jgi:hypothetical protein|nr:hypothetical protein [Candidatus Dormibacteraeota bacterium]